MQTLTTIPSYATAQELTRQSVTAPAMQRFELAMCWLLLTLKGLFFWQKLGITAGFDAGAHLEMLKLITWTNTSIGLRESFYAYHPPMAFLIARSIHLLGFSDIVSVQIVSFAASVITFLMLRQTLKYLKLLHSPAAVMFLYITCSLPLQLFLQHSVNLDGLMLMFASIVLYYSVRIFWSQDKTAPKGKFSDHLAIIAALALALMTKFTGVLLLSLPVIVAMLRPRDRQWLPHFMGAGGLALVAVGIVFPYYFTRYYIPEKTFFPNNGEWMVGQALEEARAKRDENRTEFFRNMIRPVPVHASQGLTKRDIETLRLRDTWRDFFLQEQFLGPMQPLAEKIGTIELKTAVFLVLIGLLAYLRRARRELLWERFGAVVLLFALVYMAGFLEYLYANPFAGWGPTKGIYVAPVAWAIAYLVAQAGSRSRKTRWQKTNLLEKLGLGLTAGFMIVNHALQMY